MYVSCLEDNTFVYKWEWTKYLEVMEVCYMLHQAAFKKNLFRVTRVGVKMLTWPAALLLFYKYFFVLTPKPLHTLDPRPTSPPPILV